VTRGVLLATESAIGTDGPAAAQQWDETTVLRRLLDQLGSLGLARIAIVTRPGFEEALESSLDGVALDARIVTSASQAEDLRAVAELAGRGPGAVLVAHADIVTQREALAGVLGHPRFATTALVGDTGSVGVRSDRARLVSAESPFHTVHQPNSAFLGALQVGPADRATLAAAATRLADLADARRAGELAEDVPALLIVGLVRSHVIVGESLLRELFWARPRSPDEVERAAAEIGGYDEEQVRLDLAVKPTDGFFTTFFVSPYSKYIARWAARRELTPNQVTVVSMAIGVMAAAAFATGSRAGLIAGAVLLQIAFTADCVDGQLARYTRTFTRFGAWLDSIFDRAKEYMVYAGLAIGAAHSGDPVWLLAGSALTLQTVRHAFDFSYGALEREGIQAAPQRPLEEAWDGRGPAPVEGPAAAPDAAVRPGPPPDTPVRSGPPPPRAAARALGAWRRLDRAPGLIWVKRILAFPIGERFAAISITAALFTPRTTFVVLLACSGVAALYGLTGRLLRSLR
jgi:CDP-alcohol phosphatidyltransferase-like enzyme